MLRTHTCNYGYDQYRTGTHNARKMKFFINVFFSKCDQIPSLLRIWLHLLKKSLIGKFIFCAVSSTIDYNFNYW